MERKSKYKVGDMLVSKQPNELYPLQFLTYYPTDRLYIIEEILTDMDAYTKVNIKRFDGQDCFFKDYPIMFIDKLFFNFGPPPKGFNVLYGTKDKNGSNKLLGKG